MNSYPPTVVIAIPSANMVHAGFAVSLASLTMICADPISILNGQCCNLPALRGELVDEAMQQYLPAGPSHLLFLDSDMIFPADTLHRLLAHDKDIVGATYRRMGKGFDLMGMTAEGKPIDMASPERLVEAHRLPTGILLIKMAVFKSLPRPFFNYYVSPEGIFGSEDFYFCDLAHLHGFRLWCDLDLSLECAHIKEIALRGGHSPQLLKLAYMEDSI
jgi:hypothetical protein